mmetsp:Transcript_4044/g.10293  ORF Transcript_4044/g.10293 Transcript_4044/m.10293 type:complete len:234 (-) Transcript_4044:43-744(-)
MPSQSPLAMSEGSKRGATRPTEQAPALRNSPALSRSTPDVGLMLSMGRAAETAFTKLAPPATPGNSFCTGAPHWWAWKSSVGVLQPGMMTTFLSAQYLTTSSTRTGATMNSAPASRQALTSSTFMAVPHPIITFPSYLALKSAMCWRQSGVVRVNSTISKPPSMDACIALGHASEVGVRSTAHALFSAKVSRTLSRSSRVLVYLSVAMERDPRARPAARAAGARAWRAAAAPT